MREKWIDNAKGIAILLVILGHVSGELKGVWNFQFVYGIHLVVFFLLSGYTFKKKNLTKDFINKKFVRLMIPYFYTCLAILIADAFNSWYLNQDGSIMTISNIVGRDLVRSFFASGAIQTFGTLDLGTRIGAVWFFPAMFFALLIFQWLVNKISDHQILGACCTAIALLGYITAKFIWFPFSIQSAMIACLFIWIGYEIRNRNVLGKVKWYYYLIAQLVLLAGIHFNYCDIGFVTGNMNDIILSIPVGLSGCLLVYLLSKIDNGVVLSFIGQRTSLILCVHLFLLETMGVYVNRFLDMLVLTGNMRIWIYIVTQVILAVLIAYLIEVLIKTLRPFIAWLLDYIRNRDNKKRESSIDVAKGLFIIAMIIGHFSIDGTFRKIIYSCHMMAFVLFSGYFYKSNRDLKIGFERTARNFLVPYLIFVLVELAVNYSNWSVDFFKDKVIQYILGISFAKNIFIEVPSVGPVYFILMLFLVRLIYCVIDHVIKRPINKWGIVILLSFLGMILGIMGYWLPWSADVALYSLIFYHIGVVVKKYKIFHMVKEAHMSYFLLTAVWAYMIYTGGMEIAVRNYGQYGLVVVGATAGIFTVYKLACYITDHMPVCREILRLVGENSLIIIIIHTLFGAELWNFVSKRFDSAYMPFLICQVFIQIVISLIIKYMIDCFRTACNVRVKNSC